VRYIPPFEVIKQLFEISTSKGQLRVTTSYENLIRMVKLILAGVQVDEDWYLKQYTDVAQAISDGMADQQGSTSSITGILRVGYHLRSMLTTSSTKRNTRTWRTVSGGAESRPPRIISSGTATGRDACHSKGDPCVM